MPIAIKARSRRALERQLAYQRATAEQSHGTSQALLLAMSAKSLRVRRLLERFGARPSEARVVEVGCGTRGLIFFFGAREAVGVDPLVRDYEGLYTGLPKDVTLVEAFGEALPFPDASFDIVLCDNVVDHAEKPGAIVAECVRILRPGGLLYFRVHVHHPVYAAISAVHAAVRGLRLPVEIPAFADHTYHLTVAGARALLGGLPLAILTEEVESDSRGSRTSAARHFLARLFPKNRDYEMVARKDETRSRD